MSIALFIIAYLLIQQGYSASLDHLYWSGSLVAVFGLIILPCDIAQALRLIHKKK